MIRKHRVMAVAMAVGLTLAGAPVRGQDPGRVLQQQQQQQQVLRLHEQMAHMNRTMQHMAQIQERAHQLEQQLNRQMAQLWRHEGVQEGVNQQFQIQQHERLRAMVQATNEGAQLTYRAIEQFRAMVGEPGAVWSPEAEREITRLRLHWEEMAGQMEQGLAIMERLRDRIGDPGGGW
jgi:hypothetical protein